MEPPPELPVVALPGLEGNEVSKLNSLQESLLPYLQTLESFWWLVWVGLLLYLVATHLIIPLCKQLATRSR
jgi:hypothetical protein